MKSNEFIVILCFSLLSPICRGESRDSLWIHISSMTEHRETKRWKAIYIGWEIYRREYDSASGVYVDWRFVGDDEPLGLKYLVQCALDSSFENIVASETTAARSYVLSGIPSGKKYFVRVVPAGPYANTKSDFAVGGISRGEGGVELFGRGRRFWLSVSISIAAIVLGMSVIVFILLKEGKRLRSFSEGGN